MQYAKGSILANLPDSRMHDTIRTSVNGAVHWQAWRCLDDGRYQNFILAFDVDSELFHEIKVPKSFRQDKPLDYHLSVSGDGNSIAMFTMPRGHNCTEDFLDIWVMTEYGIDDSWAKLITLSPPDPESRVPYKPLCFRKRGEVVLVSTDDYGNMHELVSLDLVSKQFKNLGIRGYGYYYAEPYEESLALLDNVDAVSYRGADQVMLYLALVFLFVWIFFLLYIYVQGSNCV
ncbi:hypothetical protein C1H46_010223 [Malus baccata]|uniref:F-box associated beta-propeller type 1 domain-containing protein n=1 Tax=Malus baccata TaxID=106549 RepID=A0A540MZQ3_MALBA|nr:hypothetical protein C1H46_010223 [Malus baccata]